MPFLYTAFHANLMFSSIEEEDRPKVIKSCYWPLLNKIDKLQIPLAIEISALTLKIIQEIDPLWLKKLNELIDKGLTEVIASGYTQLIAPLVPAKINEANLNIGKLYYKKYLNQAPKIAFFNEQAFSQSLIPIYKNAGYDSAFVEWENPYSTAKEWDSNWQYSITSSQFNGEKINLIWNHSVSFQKLQRYAHAEISLKDYEDFLQHRYSHAEPNGAYCFYAGDLETFDFRPGRFADEQLSTEQSEWDRIEYLIQKISNEKKWEFKLPSEVIHLASKLKKTLKLTDAANPNIVKKQLKYNICRWAVTGRNDLDINTRCQRIYESLLNSTEKINEKSWEEICYLWSSDFRTHITQKRWINFLKRLQSLEKELSIINKPQVILPNNRPSELPKDISYYQNGYLHSYENDFFKITLNQRRGLAVHEWACKSVSTKPLIGSIRHGKHDHIALNSDFYTGHTLYEAPGKRKIADLNLCDFSIINKKNTLGFNSEQETGLGKQIKHIEINTQTGELVLNYKIQPKELIFGSLRAGYITLLPNTFDYKSAYYESHFGGIKPERFLLLDQDIDHSQNLNLLISSLSGIGLTEGFIQLGDKSHNIQIQVDHMKSKPLAMLSSKTMKGAWFCRLAFSLFEVDETRKADTNKSIEFKVKIKAMKS